MRRWVLVALSALPALAAPSSAAAAGLPSVSSGHRPGPDVLYAPAPDAPQLDNAAPYRAPPILISGAAAYREGEWLYQDYLYDDHGATGVADPNTPWDTGDFLFSPTAGTYTYPTNPVYGDNAADLVELRIKPLAGQTAFRVTLNTLKDPARVGFTIALGTSAAAAAWPDSAGVRSPARYFLTVHGTSAALKDAVSGRALSPPPSVSVDATRRQFDVRVPHGAWDPGRSKVRVEVGVGLWDPAAGHYLVPRPGAGSASAPGGGSPLGAAIVNVGPRFDEPMPDIRQAPLYTIADAAVGAAVQSAWWREHAQATALATGDISQFSADVDFAKLAAATDDESAVPKSGPMDRILASRYQFGQGFDPTQGCFSLSDSSVDKGARCIGRFVGQLQPYALYVPPTRPAGGYGLTLLLHSLSANYNQYTNSRNQSQLGDRAPGSLVATPAGRGPDGFYAGYAEADTFEVWADVARHYPLDPSLTDVSGYSMGGFGTFRMLARYPDLFARGFSVVGAPGSVAGDLASLRNTPLLSWNAQNDELVPITETRATVSELTGDAVRFTEDLFNTADHLTLATNDWYLPGAQFLGDSRVELNPAHVTFVLDPAQDNAAAGVVADHAYWLSGLRARNPAAKGTIDVRSQGFGVADPAVLPIRTGAGALTGGQHGPMPYVSTERDWGTVAPAGRADVLVVTASNVAAARIDAARARVGCAPTLEVHSDGPLNLQIACAPPARARPRTCTGSVTLALPRVRGARIVKVVVMRRGDHLRGVHGRNLRTVAFRRVSTRAFSVRVYIYVVSRHVKLRRILQIRTVPACR